MFSSVFVCLCLSVCLSVYLSDQICIKLHRMVGHNPSTKRINFEWLYLLSFLRYSVSKNIATLKSGSSVNQGH